MEGELVQKYWECTGCRNHIIYASEDDPAEFEVCFHCGAPMRLIEERAIDVTHTKYAKPETGQNPEGSGMLQIEGRGWEPVGAGVGSDRGIRLHESLENSLVRSGGSWPEPSRSFLQNAVGQRVSDDEMSVVSYIFRNGPSSEMEIGMELKMPHIGRVVNSLARKRLVRKE